MSKKEHILSKLKEIYDSHLRLLDFLIQSEDDAVFFEEYYMDDEESVVSGIDDFRINQRLIRSIEKQEFLNIYKENKKVALETLFQEPLSNKDIEYFLQNGKPLEEVYHLSSENISLQLISLLNDYDNVKNKYNFNKPSSYLDI